MTDDARDLELEEQIAEHDRELDARDRLDAHGPAPAVSPLIVVRGEPVVLTAHALERYRGRVSRFDDLRAATVELMKLIGMFGSFGVKPNWTHESHVPEPASTYLLVGADIALPVLRRPTAWVAVTCVSRHWVREQRREALRETGRAPRGRKSRSTEGKRT
jgi:hypothetical protein